ncbi:CopD family protein [Microbispora triticiradicis]|uniref:copper resistance CopC/CopD family protein n=1 Tax=Microbispora triticiradicis TaxID=2200763 RepID=UPI001AD74FE3|nr:copper resistance protein CopC [Microbispora triticiradicis]MBO4273864.1 copper-binding protein [Microbispora triticiradicis]
MTLTRTRGAGLAVLLAGFATAVSLVVASPAWAHAELVDAAPANGQIYQDSPRTLLLQFTDPVTVPPDGLRLFGPDGARIGIGPPVHRVGDDTSVEAPLNGKLADGVYTVSWRVVSSDSHPVQGAYTFTVGTPGSRPAAVTPPGDRDGDAATAYGAARWAAFAGFGVLLGTAFYLAWCWPAGARRRTARRVLWAGWGASLAAAIASGLLYGPYVADGDVTGAFDPRLLSTTWATGLGRALGIRVALLLAAAPALVWLLNRYPDAPDRRTRWTAAAAVLAAAAALAATWSIANHSVTGEAGGFAVPFDVVHLVAGSVWLGGLVALAMTHVPTRDAVTLRVAVPRFSHTALVCVALIVATGLFQAWRQVGSPPTLFATAYGRVLLAKVALVVVLVAFGAAARGWVARHYGAGGNRRRGGPDPHQLYAFYRRLLTETAVGAVVLGLSAALVAMEPARSAAASANTEASANTAASANRAAPVPAVPTPVPFSAGSGPASRGAVLLVVFPPKVGSAQLHLSVLDPNGAPLNVPEVHAAMTLPDRDLGPIPVELQGAGGHYIGQLNLPFPGRWQAVLTVRTTETDQATVRVVVDVSA